MWSTVIWTRQENFFRGLIVAVYGRSLAIRLPYFLVIIDQVTCQLYTVLLIVNLKVIPPHFVKDIAYHLLVDPSDRAV